MKRYKLLKDLPVAKAGTIFRLNDDGHLHADILQDYDDTIVYSKSDLDKFPNILTDWFEEVNESTRWKPEKNHIYYFVIGDSYVAGDVWYGGQCVDDDRFDLGNCFQTKEEAERTVEYLKALAVVRGDATKKFTKGERNWYVFYNVTADYLDFEYDYSDIRNGIFGLPYFATEEDAQRSIKLHKKQWLTIFGIEDEE